ncbi:MAG TPA: DUF2971 domain-containing protein [Spirochaetota bacterium]|nr:DUF2971 domain-containing protein [Spirochaetota bacterium]
MNDNETRNKIIEIADAKIMDMQIGVDFPAEYFHYTSIASFLNILETGKLWLSHYNYLNDPNEVNFGIDVLKYILRQSSISEIIDDKFFNDLKNLYHVRDEHIFIFSLSQLEDSLSQWMSYGDDGAGVVLSFERNPLNFLNVTGKNIQKVFFPVLYYSSNSWDSEYYIVKDRLNGFEKHLIEFFDIIRDHIKNLKLEQELIDLVGDYVLIFSSCIKHEFFESEQEYRLFIKTGSDNNSIRTRQYGHSLKVYYETDIKAFFKSLIQKVIIGPKHYGDKRIKFGLDNQLRLNGFSDIKVVPSNGIMK